MSDTARPKSGGDRLDADEVNADLPVQSTAGETINGATLPVAVYVNQIDGELYACDADDLGALEFVGFIINNTTDGNAATLQKDGVVGGFTGLTEGRIYYVQDDKTIGLTPGTYKVPVGRSISSTEILIEKKHPKKTIANEDLRISNDTERTATTPGTSYTKIKEIEITKPIDEARVKFDLQNDAAINSAEGRVYKNGTAIGTEQSRGGTSGYQTFSEDIQIDAVPGDLIQIFVKTDSGGNVSVRNMRIYYTYNIDEWQDYTNQDP